MARKQLGMLSVALLCLGLAGTPTQAGEDVFKKHLAQLNQLTGEQTTQAALKSLVEDKKLTKDLLNFGLPAAKKKELTYNAALVLGLAAAETKDMKTAEAYIRVCMEKAAKLQSVEKLRQSYGLLIELNYDYKQFANATRLCKELLELNTDDGKDRIVIATMTNRNGEVEFREPEEAFDTAQRLRPYVLEIYIKATAKQGKFDQAIKLVEKLVKDKGDWIDHYLKGWVLREAGKFEDAATVYEDVLDQIAKDERFSQKQKDAYIEQYRYEVSNVYVEMKKIDRATEHLQFLVKKRPDDPIFYNDLGYIWADNDMKLEEAEKLIRRALELDRERRKKRPNFNVKDDHDSGAYLDSLGWVLHKQNKNKEAKEWLLKAIEDKSARHIEIYDHLADVHMALGERDAAIKAWQTGLEFVNESRRDQERKAAVEKKLEKVKSSK